jgi:hypothetical protein
MTDNEILKHYERMQEIFGEELPDPEIYPKQFSYFVKLYKKYYEESEPTMSEG